jgi:hypothetical protein
MKQELLREQRELVFRICIVPLLFLLRISRAKSSSLNPDKKPARWKW